MSLTQATSICVLFHSIVTPPGILPWTISEQRSVVDSPAPWNPYEMCLVCPDLVWQAKSLVDRGSHIYQSVSIIRRLALTAACALHAGLGIIWHNFNLTVPLRSLEGIHWCPLIPATSSMASGYFCELKCQTKDPANQSSGLYIFCYIHEISTMLTQPFYT